MKACVLHAVGDLRCQEVPRARPPAGWALVRVAACGVCGSDLPRIFEHGTYRLPLIPGHELAGVLAAPAGGLAAGRAVAVYPLVPCGECASCRRGLIQLCDGYSYLGSRGDGGFAEYAAAPVENLVPVPAGVSLEAAALTEPAAVARHALRRGGEVAGEAVWVIGAGPIGLLLVQWARQMGAGRVLVSDIDEGKLALAARWGAEAVPAGPGAAWVREQTGGGAGLVVEAVGHPETVAEALCGAAKRARVVLMGNPAGEMRLAQEAYWEILRRELTLVGTWNSCGRELPGQEHDWRAALAAMAGGELEVEPLISHRFSLAELPAGLARLRGGERYIKALALP